MRKMSFRGQFFFFKLITPVEYSFLCFHLFFVYKEREDKGTYLLMV